MKAIKILNNSLILASDDQGKEVIVMGKGIGFHHKSDQIIEDNLIEKVFVLKDEISMNEYIKLIEQTPLAHIEIVNEIIHRANASLNGKLNDQIFITLVDHLTYAITRYEKKIFVPNRLLWEVKKFYPKEFGIGVKSVAYINSRLKIDLPEEEAGNIAFHLVNAQTHEQDLHNTMLSIKMQKDIFNIVQYQLNTTIDKESLNYSRFLTHLQFFIQRLFDDKMIDTKDTFIYEQVAKEYPKAMGCAKQIKEYVKNTLEKEISREELLYLTIHIVRITT